MSMSGGRFDFEDGGTYYGEWKNNKAQGHGICTGPKGLARFEGSWNHGFELSGVYVWPTGHRFEGDWYCGKRHGLGIEHRGKWTYQGEWEEGFKARYGVQKSESGARYEGSWTSGFQEGHGVELYANGGYYNGQWKTGMRTGYGVRNGECKKTEQHFLPQYARSVSRQSTSDSIKSNGVLTSPGANHKYGKIFKRHQQALSQCSEDQLPSPKSSENGDIASESGSMNSTTETGSENSSAVDANGEVEKATVKVMERYRGEWKNDRRNGYGIMECVKHFNYTGQWQDNLRHGFGVAIFPDGTKLEGEWEQDTLTSDIKKKGPLISLVTRLRYRLQMACEAAQHAAETADQKSHVALSRAAAARDKSADAVIAAKHAREAAGFAHRKAQELITKLSNNT